MPSWLLLPRKKSCIWLLSSVYSGVILFSRLNWGCIEDALRGSPTRHWKQTLNVEWTVRMIRQRVGIASQPSLPYSGSAFSGVLEILLGLDGRRRTHLQRTAYHTSWLAAIIYFCVSPGVSRGISRASVGASVRTSVGCQHDKWSISWPRMLTTCNSVSNSGEYLLHCNLSRIRNTLASYRHCRNHWDGPC
jgi:hypothetical protein